MLSGVVLSLFRVNNLALNEGIILFIVWIYIVWNEIILIFIVKWISYRRYIVIEILFCARILLIHLIVIFNPIIVHCCKIFVQNFIAVVCISKQKIGIFTLIIWINQNWCIVESHLIPCCNVPSFLKTMLSPHHCCIQSVYLKLEKIPLIKSRLSKIILLPIKNILVYGKIIR